MFKSKISKEEISLLPILRFSDEIIIVDNIAGISEAVKELKKATVLGFDTETKPSFKKGKRNKVALLQLSTDNKAWLFRLNKIGLPSNLANVLADDKIVKVGVAIHDDIRTLQRLNHFEPKEFIDLQKIAKLHEIENFGLKQLAAIVLNVRISKRQQLSNWENFVLNESQCIYAATDAWISRKIYLEFLNTNDES